MARRRRRPADPREALVLALSGLAERQLFVTLADLAKSALRPSSGLPSDPGELAALLDGAVAELLVLKDRRTFYDRRAGTFADAWVYRVNARHPLAAALLDDA